VTPRLETNIAETKSRNIDQDSIEVEAVDIARTGRGAL